ncbi:MAG TPA: ATP-dependent helicase, partial [Usitatibacter sp.]|nr:ATP-dependent helicase [Usitatibacter sp.]
IDVLVRIYEERLAKAGTVDFQDLLEQANAGMSAASLAPFFVHHLLIDEAQDIDALQLQWIEHHLRAGAELFAVADDDQAVYGFRRALGFKGMKRLSAASGAVSLTLTTNYRSHAELVEYSQQLISHNCYREPKDTNAARGPGGGIAYLRYPDAEAQAADIVLHVGSLEGSWGILARNRHLFYDAQAFLPSAGIRARMIGPSVWKERPVRLLFVLLAMAAGLRVRPAARDALLGWLNVCHQDLEMVHSMKLAPWGLPPANLARRKTRIASRALAELMARLPVWCELAADAGRAELAIEGAGEWLCQQLERLDKPMGRRRRDLTLVGIARSALRRMDGSFGERALSIRKFDTQDAHGAVVLSTFHGAKGLEWDNVWLLSVEAAVMPYQHASTEEERRLFYVAMTRARDRLFISSRRGVPSEFLYEAFPGHRAPIASGVLHLGERIHGAITASKAVPPVV